MSSAPAHRVAAFDWQLQHPDELRALQRQYPELGPPQEVKRAGPTGAYIEDEGGDEQDYLVNLRQTLLLIATSDERSPPVIALTAWMRGLAGQYRLGLLRGHDGKIDIADRDVDDVMVEIAACYLEGRLSPADAEAELALQDLMERLNREYGDQLQMLFAMAGRRMFDHWPARAAGNASVDRAAGRLRARLGSWPRRPRVRARRRRGCRDHQPVAWLADNLRSSE
jgi:hypothetical protein